MPISFETYERLALEDDEQWELVCGRLRMKPGMTTEHIDVLIELSYRLRDQLNPREFAVRTNIGHVHVETTGSYYVPDVFVARRAAVEEARRRRPRRLEVLETPLPLVVEVWSRSTGDYDVDVKLKEYQRRGDAEIWRIHPYEHTLTASRRQTDGSYSESLYDEHAMVEPIALPGVRIVLAELFAL